jgi:nitrate/TMAO reductase-like tetraheme cytochrome c subunit
MDPVPQAMHKSQFSERHTKSEFCAPCHSQQKFNVFCSLVYDQQQQVAPEKRGQCQDCHMPAKEQGAVAVGGKMDRTPHDHTFPGGRFPEMWGKALDLELQAAREGRTELAVTVTMRSKVPHHIPDG